MVSERVRIAAEVRRRYLAGEPVAIIRHDFAGIPMPTMRDWARGKYVPFDHEHRFWERVDKSGGPDACWIWTGSKRHFGHGACKINGVDWIAHRFAYESASGAKIPSRMLVRHKCDNPPCCNPRHLELGTHQDNADDCTSRGRRIRGQAHPHAKLTDDEVLEIRKLFASGMTQIEIARKFNVAKKTVRMIVRRATWKHVA